MARVKIKKTSIVHREKTYITARRASELLGLKNVKAIYARIKNKSLRSVKKEGFWYVDKLAVEKLQGTVKPRGKAKPKRATKESKRWIADKAKKEAARLAVKEKRRIEMHAEAAKYTQPKPGQLDVYRATKQHKTHHKIHPTVGLVVAVTQCHSIGMGQKDIEDLVDSAIEACKQHPTMM